MTGRVWFDWSSYWRNVSGLTRIQGHAPRETTELYEAVADVGGPGGLEDVEADVVELSNNGLAWSLGGVTRSYRDLLERGAPEFLLDGLDAVVELLEAEVDRRGLRRTT